MKTIIDFFRPASIVGSLPNNIQNGQTEDATTVMANFNWIVNQVNANAAALSTVALLTSANTFTEVQSGVAAAAAANFPIATQVQNRTLATLVSTLGTNTITARIAALPLGAYAAGQIFTFIPSQTNTGPANMTVDSAGSTIIFSMGSTLIGGELVAGVQTAVAHDGTRLNLESPRYPRLPFYTMSAGANISLTSTALFYNCVSVTQGTSGTWFASGTVTVVDSAGAANFYAKLWDGTTLIDSSAMESAGANFAVQLSLSGCISSPSGDLRIDVCDATSSSGVALFNGTGLSKDCTITAIRIG